MGEGTGEERELGRIEERDGEKRKEGKVKEIRKGIGKGIGKRERNREGHYCIFTCLCHFMVRVQLSVII